MRSQLPQAQPRPSRKAAPTLLLTLALLGTGMAGGARTGFAQAPVAPNASTTQDPLANPAPAVAGQDALAGSALPATTDPLQDNAPPAQDGKDLTDKDKAALRKQLDALTRQRAQMDSRINALHRQLGERGSPFYNFYGVQRLNGTTPLFAAPLPGRKLTDEEKRAAQDATRQAQSSAREAMRQAQEAMRQAQKAMEEANRAMQRSGNGGGIFLMPALPSLPKLNLQFDSRLFDKNANSKNFNFQFNDKAWNSDAWQQQWKQWQEKMQKEFGPQENPF